MCTTRFSGRHGGGGRGRGQCLPRGCLPRGHVCPGRCVQGGLSRGVYPLDPEADTPNIACRDTHPLSMHTGIQPPPPPWTEGMTHACENITLPQTSFADGNKMR